MKKEPYDIEQINVMTWLRFPLIMGVVLAHCNLYAIIASWEGCNPDWPAWLVYIFKYLYWLLLPPRVPTLFIISGYFFFRSQKDRDINFFVDKYKRRVHSLLIPYLVWNAVAIMLMYFRYDVIADNGYSFTDYMSGFWSSTINDNGMPANNPLWFMRNLMVVTLMAPLIYYLVKVKYGFLAIILIAACYVTNINIPVCGISFETILFFSIGAYLAIHRVDITTIPRVLGIIMLLLYIPVQLFMNALSADSNYLYCFDLLTSFVKITAVFYLVSLLFKKKILKSTPGLSKISFLLYALHGIVINPVIMLLYKLSGCTDNPLALLGIYVTTPIIMVAVTQFLYATMTKFTPGIAKAVTGNRG